MFSDCSLQPERTSAGVSAAGSSRVSDWGGVLVVRCSEPRQSLGLTLSITPPGYPCSGVAPHVGGGEPKSAIHEARLCPTKRSQRRL